MYRGWVKVGLRVIRRVPDRGEGHGDEVDHGDPCRSEETRSDPQLNQKPRHPPPPRDTVLALKEL